MNTRLQHIDIAKGIGILLVVFAHNDIVAKGQGELYNIIYSFHLPMFMFLSGIFFNANRKVKETILSKIDSLIKPYFAILIIWFFCQKKYLFIDYFAGMLYSSGWAIPSPWTPLWFVTHLYAVTIFTAIFIKITKLNSLKILSQVFSLLCLLLMGIFIGNTFWQIPITINGHILQLFSKPFLLNGLPLSIDITFISSFFFLLGFLLKKEVVNFQVKAKYFVLMLVAFCFCHYQFNYTINFFDRRYDHPIISTLEALSGIYIILCVSKFMSKYKGVTQVFAYIGSGSLFILIFHTLFQYKAYEFLKHHYSANYFTGICAFIIGCTIPLLIWELIKRTNYLSILFLPFKSKNISGSTQNVMIDK